MGENDCCIQSENGSSIMQSNGVDSATLWFCLTLSIVFLLVSSDNEETSL